MNPFVCSTLAVKYPVGSKTAAPQRVVSGDKDRAVRRNRAHFGKRVKQKTRDKRRARLTMFTSEMESMLAMLMLIPTMTGGPEGDREKVLSLNENIKNNMQLLHFERTISCTEQSKLTE